MVQEVNSPAPFSYPAEPLARTHGPLGYKDFTDYKPFLRDEFAFRCVYCLDREAWYPNRGGSFSVDHFTPKSIDPDRETDYENLVYACVRCNSFKQATRIALDPTRVSLAEHLRVWDDGRIEYLTPEGRDLIDLLDLDGAVATKVRKDQLTVLQLKERYPADELIHALFVSRFSYPDDLPDLSKLRPPGGNSRPDGVANSHFARKKRNALPDVY
jgi:hypothetical protein